MKFENFERYIPAEIPEQFKGYNVAFFRDANGEDFYEICKKLPDETLKVLYIGDKVCSFSYAADSLYPCGYSLVEVAPDNVPEDLDDLTYKIDSEKAVFYKDTEYANREFLRKKSEKMDLANSKITYIQDKVDTGIATATDVEEMLAWKKFRIGVVEAERYEDLPENIHFGG